MCALTMRVADPRAGRPPLVQSSIARQVSAFSSGFGFDRPRGGGYGAPMIRRKLPIGIRTFREIREEGCCYVDKTACAHRLVDGGKHYFLARPRRFGKSLFVDTLKELFEGNEPLFEGLDVPDRWDWSVRHPVVRLDFSAGDFNDPDSLREDVGAQLDAVEEGAGIESRYSSGPARFHRLLAMLHERTGQRVVVLVDEYDKPILDA